MPGPEYTKRTLADEWTQSAQRDREAARLLLAAPEYDGYEMIGFHAQQAVEKLIKAMLVLHQVPFERDHNISLLRMHLRTVDVTLADALAFADWLTPLCRHSHDPCMYQLPSRASRNTQTSRPSSVMQRKYSRA
jgi:HEPN domain-containing protein